MAFQCPPNAEIYFEQVVKRCRGYLRLHLWEIEQPTLDGWLTNFSTLEERYLAARLLDKAIFRSESQIRAMIVQLLQRTLADALAAPNEFGEDWQAVLKSEEKDPRLRLVPVIRDTDSPAKSGPLVARLFRRLGEVSDDWMVWPWLMQGEIDKGNKIVLIDDFIGSGQQFINFANRFLLHQVCLGQLIYSPLVAHEQGLITIRETLPNIRVVPGEVLTANYSTLQESSEPFDSHNSQSSARQFYKTYWNRKNIQISKSLLFGWEELSLVFAFNHGSPNATLPLFWMNRGHHKRIFTR